MSTRIYATDEVEVSWDASRCIHVARCLNAEPDAFDVHRRPWIVPEAVTPERIIAAVAQCPSGALGVRRVGEEGPAEELPQPPQITLVPNGPFAVRGVVQVQQPDGTVVSHRGRATLCRCGASENKPFCDNSHRRVGFSTSDEAPPPEDLPRVPADERTSPADCG